MNNKQHAFDPNMTSPARALMDATEAPEAPFAAPLPRSVIAAVVAEAHNATEAEAGAGVTTGVVVAHPDAGYNVLTTADLERQRAEQRAFERWRARDLFSQALIHAADAILEATTPVAVLLLFVGFWLHGYATISLLLKQAQPASSLAPRIVPCITTHYLVQFGQVLMLSIAAVLGNHQMTLHLIGETNRDVQPRRLFWLFVMAVYEAFVVVPLCGPEIAPTTPTVVPLHCHVGQPLPANADQEQRLSALLMNWTFLEATYLISLTSAIFFFLAMGLIVPRPAICCVPLVATFGIVSSVYLQFLIYLNRDAQSLIVRSLVTFDTCFADLAALAAHTALGVGEYPPSMMGPESLRNATLSAAAAAASVGGDKAAASIQGLGGIYGPRVAWTFDAPECRPTLLYLLVWGLSTCVAVIGGVLYSH